MKKMRNVNQSKARKNNHEEKFESMVKEYQEAKTLLDSMDDGSDEQLQQQRLCDSLFAKAEKFFTQHN
ncbi:hypothetical protein JYB87_17890 [Shewanella avicenniae]|uniref:Rop-like n=1 Tax=Shewanella avicenniae TaxID=2814294 RepID=A0ABX7QPZ8_9GAMM|nr:hypothetical protein [Shewanella avicenniae]QSX33554.1 hypothetical protein JYB87_17890 [Shewanella avicenniae]